MSAAGRRDKLISILRAGPSTDDGMNTQPGAFAEFTKAWAEVLFGTGAERRQAAQEHAGAPATFIIPANTKTRSITPADKLSFMGADWDISSSIPGRDRSEWQVTATRSA